jgi:hypothetical protein
MKLVALFIVFFSISCNSYAAWEKLASRSTPALGTWSEYVDYETMVPKADGFEIWVMNSFIRPQTGYNLELNKEYKYSSSIKLARITCSQQKAMAIDVTDYKLQMGKGDIAYSVRATEEDIKEFKSRISPDSSMMILWKKFCK